MKERWRPEVRTCYWVECKASGGKAAIRTGEARAGWLPENTHEISYFSSKLYADLFCARLKEIFG
jgi:hypothetical protein